VLPVFHWSYNDMNVNWLQTWSRTTMWQTLWWKISFINCFWRTGKQRCRNCTEFLYCCTIAMSIMICFVVGVPILVSNCLKSADNFSNSRRSSCNLWNGRIFVCEVGLDFFYAFWNESPEKKFSNFRHFETIGFRIPMKIWCIWYAIVIDYGFLWGCSLFLPKNSLVFSVHGTFVGDS